jgi:nucleotide-binding universal stress UspA family protein
VSIERRRLTPLKPAPPASAETDAVCTPTELAMYQRILVPIDASAPSQAGLEEAIRLARAGNARLLLVHVMDGLAFANGFETGQAFCAEMLPMMRRRAEALLEKCRARAEAAGVPAETAVREGFCGTVCQLVVEMAASWGADVIVIGTHGRHGIERFVMGSDAEQILRASRVPVLLVKESAAAEATG